MLAISLFAGAIYYIIEDQYKVGVPILIIAVFFSKYATGYYWLGLEVLIDSDSDSSSDSCGGDGGGGGGGD